MKSANPSSEARPDDAVRLFCMIALERGYITDTQCRILKKISEDHLDLQGFLRLVSALNIGVRFADPMNALSEEIQSMSLDEVADRIREKEESPPKLVSEIPLDMEWFCFFVTREKLLTPEQCLEIHAELGAERDFLRFAQTVVMVLPPDKFPRIQQIVERVMEYARTGHTPPERILASAVKT